MSGVSVTPFAPSEGERDLQAIASGGANFMARAKHISELWAGHDLAFAQLHLGSDAKRALDAAEQKQREVESKLDEANRTLAQAERTAADIIQKAKDQARSLLKSSEDNASQLIEQANATKNDADTYARDKRLAADAVLASAKESETSAARTMQEANDALQRHQEAEIASQNANGRASDLTARLHNALSTLDEVLQRTREKIKL